MVHVRSPLRPWLAWALAVVGMLQLGAPASAQSSSGLTAGPRPSAPDASPFSEERRLSPEVRQLLLTPDVVLLGPRVARQLERDRRVRRSYGLLLASAIVGFLTGVILAGGDSCSEGELCLPSTRGFVGLGMAMVSATLVLGTTIGLPVRRRRIERRVAPFLGPSPSAYPDG